MLLKQIETLYRDLDMQGFDVRDVTFEPPASEEEVREVEASLRLSLPPSFRRTLMEASSCVSFCWFAPEGVKFAPPFESNFSGNLQWSLERLEEIDADRQEWALTSFSNRDDAYDSVWWDKLAFYEVGNGDLLAIDLRPATYEQIVYLSHDDGEGHGYVLAEDFGALLRRWAPLAFVGGEDWQWLPFTAGKTGCIDPACETARRWRSLIGLE